VSNIDKWSPFEVEPFKPRTTQKYVARCAIGPSTVRNMGVNLRAAQDFLAELDINDLRAEKFEDFLENETVLFEKKCAAQFGVARKCLNIFLRNASHNFWMRNKFNFVEIESKLEIPLDSRTMSGIRLNRPFLRKSSVKDIPRDLHDKYQSAANEIAQEKGTSRIHLDLDYWLVE
jgi:hypothetical protein